MGCYWKLGVIKKFTNQGDSNKNTYFHYNFLFYFLNAYTYQLCVIQNNLTCLTDIDIGIKYFFMIFMVTSISPDYRTWIICNVFTFYQDIKLNVPSQHKYKHVTTSYLSFDLAHLWFSCWITYIYTNAIVFILMKQMSHGLL